MARPCCVSGIDTHTQVFVVENHHASIGGQSLPLLWTLGLTQQISRTPPKYLMCALSDPPSPPADAHPTAFAPMLFPGQDYNVRELDFQHVDDYVINHYDVLEAAQMPWHDVHVQCVLALLRGVLSVLVLGVFVFVFSVSLSSSLARLCSS
jgi:hypothetical protein